MNHPESLPPEPLGWTEHQAVTLTPARHDPKAPADTRLGAFAADGTFLDGFRMLRGHAASPPEAAPASVGDHLTGTWIYGGVMRPHYGHFLLESMARAWFLRRRPDLPILWHAANGRDALFPWHREVLSLLGIPAGRCRFVLRPAGVERIILPDPGCIIERSLDPAQARALGAFPFAGTPRRGRKVWLSRSGLQDGLARIEGEAELEACLVDAGWTILRPETLPVWQQLAAMADAEEIAGFEGSAFHTLLLADQVPARVTLYRRSADSFPVSHAMIASAKRLRQSVKDLPVRHTEGEGRRRMAALEDPAAAARIVDPACRPRPVAAPRPRPPSAREAPPAHRLAFVHIPKTAGTSFTRALAAGWPRGRIVATSAEFDAIPDAEMRELDLIAGHFYAHRLEGRGMVDFAAVTVLRDPFERLFSAYRFGRQYAELGHAVGPAMRLAGQTSFGEWAFSPHGAAQRHAHLYILGLDPGDRAQAVPLTRLLDRARARLEGMLVGTVDRLDDFVGFVFRHHGLPAAPPMERAMASERYGLDKAGLTAAQREALIEALRPDYELYAHGRELMLRRLEAKAPAAA